MICTLADARRILTAEYGHGFKFRIAKGRNVGMRQNHELAMGKVMLVWEKLDKGPDSAVRIGRWNIDTGADWDYVPEAARA
jgi:hypothetical protein